MCYLMDHVVYWVIHNLAVHIDEQVLYNSGSIRIIWKRNDLSTIIFGEFVGNYF